MNAQTNAIEVALHRALGRLRRLLEAGEAEVPPAAPARPTVRNAAPVAVC